MKESNIGYLDSIETMGLVDGPGIRVVIFLQGCPLRCIFCHNPETWKIDNKMPITAEELVNKIKKYKNYFGNNGGVTFSGGEPLTQHAFLLEVLKLCKKENINTCLDTSGVGDNYQAILEYVDLVIWDIKALSEESYIKITGYNIKKSLEFLNYCQSINKKMWLRQVIVPGINDNDTYILELAEFIKKLNNIEKVELLPYHTDGVKKYEKLNISYKLGNTKNMDVEICKKLEEKLREEIWKKN